jgi:pilus assembly protein CpaD
VIKMRNSIKKPVAAAIIASLGLALAGCMGGAGGENRSLESIKQPVVERNSFSIDLVSGAGGLSVPEQKRLADWFEAMDLRYGDKIFIDDPIGSGETRDAIAAIAARYNLLVNQGAPVTAGYVDAGTTRVIVTRSSAHVPGCPDWSDTFASNLGNKTASGFGCAVNSNLAAMVADPEHLIEGARGSGETIVMSSNKAIDTYRKAPPTGTQGLIDNNTPKSGT